jgi:excinuclease UvrABC helicase subunit UvrB
MTRTLLHFTENILKSAQSNQQNKANDTPRMVAERYQHQQLLMLYDTWQENGGDMITVNPGNPKKRVMRPRRFSEEVSQVKMIEPDIS